MKLCGKGLHDLDDPAVVYIVPNTGAHLCGPCHRVAARVRAKQQHALHPERAREYSRARHAANPARTREYARKWRRANPVRYRETIAQWRAANSMRHHEYLRNGKARRRARLANALATLTATQWEAILVAADYVCIYCGSTAQISMDHLIPIAQGGDHTAENVAPACLPCNRSKGAKAVAEFLTEMQSA